MKKTAFILIALFCCASFASAQKYALVDMEYILKNIPAYERANEQLNQSSRRWQAEVETLAKEAETLYKNYQSESVFLSAEQKTKREEEITTKEQEARDLKHKYFGPEGELYKKRESLMAPIQDEIYNAVKEVAELRGYSMVIDRASASSIIYATPKIDISNEVLSKLGYAN
ncbi:MAG: OmpH family outer membrane protein [Bacteroidaceae bacterium]|jgi:outer membrane protein